MQQATSIVVGLSRVTPNVSLPKIQFKHDVSLVYGAMLGLGFRYFAEVA